MPCCAIAFVFIVKYVIGRDKLLELFGIRRPAPADPYAAAKWCELDDYED